MPGYPHTSGGVRDLAFTSNGRLLLCSKRHFQMFVSRSWWLISAIPIVRALRNPSLAIYVIRSLCRSEGRRSSLRKYKKDLVYLSEKKVGSLSADNTAFPRITCRGLTGVGRCTTTSGSGYCSGLTTGPVHHAERHGALVLTDRTSLGRVRVAGCKSRSQGEGNLYLLISISQRQQELLQKAMTEGLRSAQEVRDILEHISRNIASIVEIVAAPWSFIMSETMSEVRCSPFSVFIPGQSSRSASRWREYLHATLVRVLQTINGT